MHSKRGGANPKIAVATAVVALMAGLGVTTANGQDSTNLTGPYADELAYLSAVEASSTYISAEDAVGLIRDVELTISDQVTDGCWTNADSIKSRIRVELERSGIAVYEEKLAFKNQFAPGLLFSALGYRIGSAGACVGTVRLETYYQARNQLGGLSTTGRIFKVGSYASAWEKAAIFSSGGTLDAQLLEWAQSQVDTLIADILKARRAEEVQSLLRVWNKAPPMTGAQFAEFLTESQKSGDP